MAAAVTRWLEVPPAEWDALVAADANATPAHRPGVWAALCATLPGLEARLVAVEREGTLLGGAPVLLERRAGLLWIHALPFLLPGAPLARAGHHREVDTAVAAALGELQHGAGAVGGEWALYRPAGPVVEVAALSAVSGETRVLEAAVLDLEHGLEPLLRDMDRKVRQEIRQGGLLRFREEPAALEEAWALHATQARAWRGHRLLPLELSRRLLEPHAGGPLARLFTVRDARGLLAAVLALDQERETLLWWSGSHPEARARHAFPRLLWGVAEWAAAAGRARLNLGASADRGPIAAFKRGLGGRGYRYPVRWLDAARAPGPARGLAVLQRWWRRGRPRGEAA